MSDEQKHGSIIPSVLAGGAGGAAGAVTSRFAKSHVEKVSGAMNPEKAFAQNLAATQTKVWDAAADGKPFADLSDSIKAGFGEKGVEAFKKYHETLSQNPVTSREAGLQAFNASDKSFETLVAEHKPSRWTRIAEETAEQAAKRPLAAAATGAVVGVTALAALRPKHHTERLAARDSAPGEGRTSPG